MKSIKANKKIRGQIDRINELNRKIATLKIEKDMLTDEIKELMENEKADTLKDEKDEVIIGILQTRGGILKFDSTLFKMEHETLWKQYLAETPTYKVFIPK